MDLAQVVPQVTPNLYRGQLPTATRMLAYVHFGCSHFVDELQLPFGYFNDLFYQTSPNLSFDGIDSSFSISQQASPHYAAHLLFSIQWWLWL